MTNWVHKKGSEVTWKKGILFSFTEGGLDPLTWKVAEISPSGEVVDLILPNKGNMTNRSLQGYSVYVLHKNSYWFKVDTLEPVSKESALLAKIKYLDNKYATRQKTLKDSHGTCDQQKPVSQMSTDW